MEATLLLDLRLHQYQDINHADVRNPLMNPGLPDAVDQDKNLEAEMGGHIQDQRLFLEKTVK